jgi:hypothetical protein
MIRLLPVTLNTVTRHYCLTAVAEVGDEVLSQMIYITPSEYKDDRALLYARMRLVENLKKEVKVREEWRRRIREQMLELTGRRDRQLGVIRTVRETKCNWKTEGF